MTGSLIIKDLTADINGIPFCARHFEASGASHNTVLICLPGGGASRDYFDLLDGYSFAANMTQQGYDVLTMDHPGTATNPLPDGTPFLTPRRSSDYIGACLSQVLAAPEFTGKRLIGLGHSMGGMMTVLTQARHGLYDGLVLIGSSAGGLEWGLDDKEKAYIDKPEAFERDMEVLTMRKFKMPFPPSMGGPSGKSITFGGETDDLNKRLRETTCNLFAAGGMMSMTRGSFIKEVEAIDVPMFFAFGDHDIGIPPEDAPKDFINAASTELYVMENTGHNSFAFSSLTTLCEKMDEWMHTL